MKFFEPGHFDILRIAQDCLALGARVHTTRQITGLARHTLSQMAVRQSKVVAHGRPSDGCLWYVREQTRGRVEACIFASHFKRLRGEGFGRVQALLSAYRYVFGFAQGDPRLTFEHAFDLAAKAEGSENHTCDRLHLSTCNRCDCRYIVKLKDWSFGCPFCSLLETIPPVPLDRVPSGIPHEQN